MFAYKPDYEQAQKRVNAFWNHEEVDRPLTNIIFQKPGTKPFLQKTYATHEERWLDLEYRTAQTAHNMANTVFYADAMPVFFPDLGPEIISAWAGCPYIFGEDTTWTTPCIFDWNDDNAVIDMNHSLAKKLEDFTRMLLEAAKGKFIVGLSDFHPGGDHIAALRDVEVLAIDLLEEPDRVKAKLASSYKEYFAVYDYYVNWLKKEDNPIASWIGLTSETSMYIPSNDFSIMISEAMFDEFFLPGITEECRHYGNSIYHLDGPGALRHLDSLLAIPQLDAVQWVYGAGNGNCTDWLHVYKKVLGAGKSATMGVRNMDELRILMEHLPARGLCIDIYFAKNEDEARDIFKLIEKWPRNV